MSDIEGAFEKLTQVMTEMDTKQAKNDKILAKLKVIMDADRGKVIILSSFFIANKSCERGLNR